MDRFKSIKRASGPREVVGAIDMGTWRTSDRGYANRNEPFPRPEVLLRLP